ncbi:MAG: RNA polymerase sigma factor SigM [Mycobacterium sp.]|nr:RNA polymerase sigma factor SigM [Mycobacterium sp.]
MPSWSDRSDAELLYAHVAGDRYAFEELFRRHRDRLYRVARRRSHTAEDAHDAVQDAMLSAHRAAPSFRHDAAVGSWLSRIVVNACRDRLRRSIIRPTIALVETDCPPVADRTGELETALVVAQALRRLPVQQRDAVVAIDMHGYSVADAAALLEVAEGTVKSRCARGRARLAGLLRCPGGVWAAH